MTSTKYIGMDVHKESISIAVMNAAGKASDGMRHRDQGEYHSAVYSRIAREICMSRFEEGTWAAWLYDLLKPHVTESRGV